MLKNNHPMYSIAQLPYLIFFFSLFFPCSMVGASATSGWEIVALPSIPTIPDSASYEVRDHFSMSLSRQTRSDVARTQPIRLFRKLFKEREISLLLETYKILIKLVNGYMRENFNHSDDALSYDVCNIMASHLLYAGKNIEDTFVLCRLKVNSQYSSCQDSPTSTEKKGNVIILKKYKDGSKIILKDNKISIKTLLDFPESPYLCLGGEQVTLRQKNL